VRYAAGEIGPDKGGAGWRWPFPAELRSVRSCELQYMVEFERGFDFVKGGKLPGLCGGPKTITGGKDCTGLEGWSVRLMWRRDGRGQAYVYHAAKRRDYGDEFDFPDDARFPIGRPVNVRIRVTMNDVGQRNGALQVWLSVSDGQPLRVVERTDLEFTRAAAIGIDSILFNTFHGGNDKSWAPPADCQARFTSFRVAAR
jgi:hypothetical protein